LSEPACTVTHAAPAIASAPEPESASEPVRPPEKKKRRSRTAAAAPPPAAVKAEPTPSNNRSAIMQQYQAAKEKHPDMLLLFRMGDFFELFGDDAETAHRLLGLTLTTRDGTLTMAGFPHHQLESYLHKLLKEGQRVAVCEPVDESLARGPIRREVTRVVTPGTGAEDDASKDAVGSHPAGHVPVLEGRAVKQPRHFVLKQYETWMNEVGLAFVAVADVGRTTPAMKPFIAGLDFIVLRGETKLLVTVRPHLQGKHFKAIAELQKLFGSEYRPVRVWPTEGPDGWNWQEHGIDSSAAEGS
jgi:MutS domain I